MSKRAFPDAASYAPTDGASVLARAKQTVDQAWQLTSMPLAIGGSANALTGTSLNGFELAAYAAGQKWSITPIATNTTAVTIAIDGLANRALKDEAGNALAAGSLRAGTTYPCEDDGSAIRVLRAVPRDSAQIGLVTGFLSSSNASSPNTKVDYSIDAIRFVDGSGIGTLFSGLSGTIDCGTNGVNGLDTGALAPSSWYAKWAISNGVAAGMLMSLSDTSPTMPSGYSLKIFVGYERTDGASHLYPMRQDGKDSYWKRTASGVGNRLISNGTVGTVSAGGFSGSLVSISGFAPPKATHISLKMSNAYAGGLGCYVYVAENGNNSGGETSTLQTPYATCDYQIYSTVVIKDMPLESSSIFYGSGGTAGSLWAVGFKVSAPIV